jgi:hypothetical protein
MRGRGRRCSALRVAFNVAGAQPCGHFVRLAGVFVVHDGVQRGHGFHSLRDERANRRGVLSTIFLARKTIFKGIKVFQKTMEIISLARKINGLGMEIILLTKETLSKPSEMIFLIKKILNQTMKIIFLARKAFGLGREMILLARKTISQGNSKAGQGSFPKSIASSNCSDMSRVAIVPVRCSKRSDNVVFAVVNVGDDAEISDVLCVHRSRARQNTRNADE